VALMKVCVLVCLGFAAPLCMSYGALGDDAPAAESQSVLPKIKSMGTIYYPDKAKRLNAQGRFLLAFRINDHGRAAEIKIESAEGSEILSDSAVTIVKNLVFERPAAPASAVLGSEKHRMSVVFELEPCGRLQHFDVPKDARISVCGSRLRAPKEH
jgi:TonB family protein